MGILCENFCSASLSAQEAIPMEQSLVRHICPAANLLLEDFLQGKMCFALTQGVCLPGRLTSAAWLRQTGRLRNTACAEHICNAS